MPGIGRRKLTVALFALTLGTACGGRQATPPVARRGAAEIAVELVDAKITALVHVERVMAHPAHERLLAASGLDEVARQLGIDVARDLAKVFVAAKDAKNRHDVVIVAEHRMTEERARALDGKIVTAEHERRVVRAPSPGLLVALPESWAAKGDLFRDAGPLSAPTGNEAATLSALDPGHTLSAPGAPAIPASLSRGRAVVTLSPDGSLDVALDGDSTSPAQASADAAALTSSVDAATSRKVFFVRVRLFDTIPFRATGNQINAGLHLSPAELEQLLTLARARG